MPGMKVVERDYVNLYNHFISFGPKARQTGIGANGVHWEIEDMYDEMLETHPTVKWKNLRGINFRN